MFRRQFYNPSDVGVDLRADPLLDEGQSKPNTVEVEDRQRPHSRTLRPPESKNGIRVKCSLFG